ncbi:uncharacterized protein K444DRAFT_723081 [Hyaloscypha bicolor E]|uniref:Methyltransferase domain-containing protein n=1 Tax=Hyaloscypha bicolor E TaxID=1095630 RepID=A0A2J6T9T3_9HELO|nr:uncharacterized protein K444DRAFT_723081 [Hyaloscypha bicolor E]PMD59775.1 hypothetical protein K444DRAFT_723081 [Hyaloscypha bicolor E]
MPETSDTCLLQRDENEFRRINRQHRLWTRTLDYLIHPAIDATLPKDSKIADVATGTGIWALATARALTESVTLVGFDNCKNQFPHPDSIPKNVSFEAQNLLKPFPIHHQGAFDLVSIRLVASALKKEEWELAARNLFSLLKPGGYIQWMEADISESCTPLQNTPQACSHSLASLAKYALSFLHSKGTDPSGCRRLLEIFRCMGLEDCTQDVFSSDRDPSLRAEFSDVHARALLGILEQAGLQMWSGWNLEKVREWERRVVAELETGRVPGIIEK